MRLFIYFFIYFLIIPLTAQESSLFSKPKVEKEKKESQKKIKKNDTQVDSLVINSPETEISINKLIDGTLLTPVNLEKPNLAILIAGSGPTDRDGNQNFLKNNTLKKIATGLYNNDIASFRYDKRIVKQIKKGKVDPTINFRDFITDAVSVIRYFKNSNKFNKIYIIGHSQGSLVGLITANKIGVHGIISLAGAGRSIDEVIKEQIDKTAPMFNADTEVILKSLKKGETIDKFPEALASIFNKDVQPFMISWMHYKPIEEIKKLTIPALIINGTKDLQVSKDEADLLKNAYSNAQLKVFENMNHVLVTVDGDDLENSKTYNKPELPLADGLIDSMTGFIKNNTP